MSTEISFGKWLRHRRRALDLTQEALAGQVGCARITLRKIEADTLRPSRELAQILLEKLGIATDREAWLEFARGASGLPPEFVPSSGKPSSNLPASLTTFVGREKEQSEVINLIAQNRLVTLVGPGGIGKTRLSIQAANEIRESFPDGVWLVELAPILDSSLVPRTTAATLGLHDQSQRAVIDILCDYLRPTKILLILDNCEHLVEVCAHMAQKILTVAPDVHLISTSREVLGIPGEAVYWVPSLGVPDVEHFHSITSLSKSEAVQLFMDRATRAVPTFQITDDTVVTLAKICSHLDGIPLAIELAAAKLRVLSPEQIHNRLDNRFRLLRGGSRTVLPQHQTLQAAVDWSYDLLSVPERTLFRRLAIFLNGWTLEAAESVCANRDIQPDEILEVLTQLINKSLIMKEGTGENRYRMLETIREYALEKLRASSEMNTIQLRHTIFFTKLVNEANQNFKGSEQSAWYSRLDHELDNLRAAINRFKGPKNTEIRLQLTAGLWRYWKNRGRSSEGRAHLQHVLEDIPAGQARRTSSYARALTAAGSLAYYEGDFFYSEQTRNEALAIFRNLDDKVGIADCLNGLGNIALSQGHYDAARASYEESLLIRRNLGDQWGIARLLGNLGLLAYFQTDYLEAHSLHGESLALFRTLGDEEGVANELVNLGDVARHQGEFLTANLYYQESAAISSKLKDQWGLGYALLGLADVALAERHFSAACSLYRDCLKIFQTGTNYVGLPFALESVTSLALVRNQPEKAAQILGAANALRKSTNSPLPPPDRSTYKKILSDLQQQLEPFLFDFAWTTGEMMPVNEVLDLALRTIEEM